MDKIVEEMKSLASTRGKHRGKCHLLMERSRPMRRKWIVNQRPETSEIYTRYPLYKDLSIVRAYLTFNLPNKSFFFFFCFSSEKTSSKQLG